MSKMDNLYWSRTSERNLVYQIYKSQRNLTKGQKALEELTRRLNRLFNTTIQADGWQILHRHQDEIIDELIFRLYNYYPKFKGNSREYRKYIYRTAISVCANFLKDEIKISHSLNAPLSNIEQEDTPTTMLDLLATYLPLTTTPYSASFDWQEINDSFKQLTPAMAFTDEESYRLIQQAQTKLSKRCQKLLHKADVLNQKHEVIAQEMDMKPNAVTVALSRCRRKLLRNLIPLLASEKTDLQLVVIKSAIAQLTNPQQTIVQAWWDGETSWKKIGELLAPSISSTEVKRLFVSGLISLFALLPEIKIEQLKELQ